VQNNRKRPAKRKFIGTDRVVSSDGEVLDEVPRFKISKRKPVYATMYLDDERLFEALQGLGNFGACWGYVLKEYKSDNGIFYFSSSVKDEMCKALGLSIGTVRSAIKSFCDSGLLLRYKGAEYLVNPSLFYRGVWENRQAMIEKYELKREENEIRQVNKSVDSRIVKIK
jgi:hypothetical protein